jgi:hypothetical protein
MMRADWMLVTGAVATGKVALAEPAETVTLAGTVAAAVSSLDRATDTPPVAAGDVKVTVPVTRVPPTTSVAFSFTEDNAGVRLGLGLPPEASAADGALKRPMAAATATRIRVLLIDACPFVAACGLMSLLSQRVSYLQSFSSAGRAAVDFSSRTSPAPLGRPSSSGRRRPPAQVRECADH